MALREITTNSGSSSKRYESENLDFDEKGQTVEGHLVEKVTLKSKATGKPFQKYTIKTSSGYVSTLGSHQLDRALEQVLEGSLIRITFNGVKKLDGGRKVKLFKVEADEDNRISA